MCSRLQHSNRYIRGSREHERQRFLIVILGQVLVDVIERPRAEIIYFKDSEIFYVNRLDLFRLVLRNAGK